MDATPAQRVGASVRAEMARRRKSQADLAALLGTSQAAVSRRLSGAVAFDVDELTVIAEHLGVPLVALLADAPHPPSPRTPDLPVSVSA